MTTSTPLSDAALRAWKADDLRRIDHWAHDELTLPKIISKHGPFSADSSRHFILPLEAVQSDEVREVNILAPVRSGKTLIADLLFAWSFVVDPGSFRWVFQDESTGKEHMDTRLLPMVTNSRCYDSIRPTGFDNTKKHLYFRNGYQFFIDGPSLGKLQSKPFRRMVLDEVWCYKAGTIGHAKARLDDFYKMGLSKLLCISQGGTIDDDWHIQYQSGVVHQWQVKCRECGSVYVPEFTGYRDDGTKWGLKFEYQKLDDGRRVLDNADSIHFECRDCRSLSYDERALKAFWNSNGTYGFGGEWPEEISFQWSNMIDLPWRQLVKLWLSARDASTLRGDEEPTIQLIQKRFAEFYDPAKVLIKPDIPTVHLDESKHWENQDFIFLTVDVQETHYWYLVEAWSKTGESMVLEAGTVFGFDGIRGIQAKFDIKPRSVVLDCGFRRSEVFFECTMNGWLAMKGDSKESFDWFTGKGAKKIKSQAPIHNIPWQGEGALGFHKDDPRLRSMQGKPACYGFNWSNPWIKSIAMSRREMMEKGKVAFVSDQVSDDFKLHLYSERKTKDVVKGKKVTIFKQIGKKPNHLFDCWCMSLALAHLRGIVSFGELVESVG